MAAEKNVKVSVSQKGGDISIARDGSEPTTYKVSDDGTVSVKESDLPTFLAVVEGSAETGGK